jgi:hypothetical protein
MRKFGNTLFIILFAGVLHILAAEEKNIHGTVFEDINHNGTMDRGEQGIPGVVVSNQIEVARTDQDGGYKLPVHNNMIVFVSAPSNYSAPLNRHGLPQFYYIHQPQGSPQGLRYPGIKPTGDLPDVINFPLNKTEYRAEFNIIVSGDPQVGNEAEVGYLRDDILPRMIGRDAAFYLALGDNAADNLSIYPSYLEALSQLHIPLYHVLGNHDENYDVPGNESANETFRSIFGPEYYSFNYGQVHFILLDVVEYRGWNKEKNHAGSYRGFLTDTELTWLENDLKFTPEDQLIVLAMHIPLATLYAPESDSENVVNRERLFQLLQNRRYLLALSGHLHVIENFYLTPETGWNSPVPFFSLNAGAACGSWWSGPKDDRGIPVSHCMDGSPNGFFQITFKENTFDYHFIPAKKDESFQMRISSPDSLINQAQADSIQVIANIFCADPQSKVYYQLDNMERQAMQPKKMVDPYMELYMTAYRSEHPTWIKSAIATDHIWAALLPANLAPGRHILKISAVDSRGKSYSGLRIFQITRTH